MVVVNWRSERALPCPAVPSRALPPRVRSKYYRQLLQFLRRRKLTNDL